MRYVALLCMTVIIVVYALADYNAECKETNLCPRYSLELKREW